MRGQGQYLDSGMNQMVASQMHHAQAQRLQRNSGMGHYPERADILQAEEERQYMSLKGRQWLSDRDGPKGSNVTPPHMYKEGRGGDASRYSYQGRRPDQEVGLEKQSNKGPRDATHEAEMEVGYEDNSLPQTFESLEQKFIHDIMKLTKEQQDAEDLENARHRERLNEINVGYQEKLVAMRVRQATCREDILRQESQARHQKYQQANMKMSQNCARPSDDALGFESYGERANFSGAPRGRDYEPRGQYPGEPRGQYPGGRAYNSGGRNF